MLQRKPPSQAASMRPDELVSPPAAGIADRDRSLDGLRAVAIGMVVAIHTSGYVALPPGPTTDTLQWLIRTVAVPVFFLVDGLLFARGGRAGRAFDAPTYLRRSAWRLLLPWLVFSVLYLALRWAYERFGAPPTRILAGQGAAAWLEALVLGLASPQLYFLPSLFAIRLLAPWLRVLALRNAIARWLAFGAVAMVADAFLLDAYRTWLPLPGYDPLLHALWGLPFYLLGVAISDLRLRGVAPVVVAILVLAAARAFWPEFVWASRYSYLAALFLSFACLDLTPPWLAAIGRRTMGVYLLHAPLILWVVSRALERWVAQPWLLFAAVWLASLCLSLLATSLLERARFGRVALGEAL